ncbi:hypothetical protein [Sphingosinicella sp. BN140058]|uniref:hypothetical protein n=1 Tax=Sphingosinicella sp. BN140058 TaxID=1892855 RepID=UPI001010BB41|nr:hypothetical protein [Sphingosinicella sp. BN140058]QAY77792.1 hypothetical protein ETR14_15670 [Sphingosinicella sp. BN140058]
MLSPLAIPPLPAIGRWAARKVHGNRRSTDGYLLTERHFIDEDTEWRLGQAYLGVLGFPLFFIDLLIVRIFFGHLAERHSDGALHFGFWSDLVWQLKLLFPLAVIFHIGGMASIVRLFVVWGQLGLRSDLGE